MIPDLDFKNVRKHEDIREYYRTINKHGSQYLLEFPPTESSAQSRRRLWSMRSYSMYISPDLHHRLRADVDRPTAREQARARSDHYLQSREKSAFYRTTRASPPHKHCKNKECLRRSTPIATRGFCHVSQARVNADVFYLNKTKAANKKTRNVRE